MCSALVTAVELLFNEVNKLRGSITEDQSKKTLRSATNESLIEFEISAAKKMTDPNATDSILQEGVTGQSSMTMAHKLQLPKALGKKLCEMGQYDESRAVFNRLHAIQSTQGAIEMIQTALLQSISEETEHLKEIAAKKQIYVNVSLFGNGAQQNPLLDTTGQGVCDPLATGNLNLMHSNTNAPTLQMPTSSLQQNSAPGVYEPRGPSMGGIWPSIQQYEADMVVATNRSAYFDPTTLGGFPESYDVHSHPGQSNQAGNSTRHTFSQARTHHPYSAGRRSLNTSKAQKGSYTHHKHRNGDYTCRICGIRFDYGLSFFLHAKTSMISRRNSAALTISSSIKFVVFIPTSPQEKNIEYSGGSCFTEA
uniref:C2H2-type domain-containing protein n=1 Tax=Ditylenchus dipsaci TaxID=166011 RepID=A0A915D1N8_9BILA